MGLKKNIRGVIDFLPLVKGQVNWSDIFLLKRISVRFGYLFSVIDILKENINCAYLPIKYELK